MARLSEAQKRGLLELEAACDERIRYYGGEGLVRTFDICGTPAERSSSNMKSLVALGFAEGKKADVAKQQQHRWRITEAGRLALKGEPDE